MVGNKLDLLNSEIQKYLGIPYFKNTGKHQNHGPNVFVGKGTAHEIALETINLANQNNLRLVDLSAQQIYNFQKKHHLGIDCSGLVCHLLNFLFNKELNPRTTSADMLTSPPLAQQINASQIEIGDLIRQKNGHHVLLVTNIFGDKISYIDSSLLGRGVRLGIANIQDKDFRHEGIFRIN